MWTESQLQMLVAAQVGLVLHKLVQTPLKILRFHTPGSLAIPLALRGAAVSASDISGAMASEAKARWDQVYEF